MLEERDNIDCKVETRDQIPIEVRNVLKCKVETRHEGCGGCEGCAVVVGGGVGTTD